MTIDTDKLEALTKARKKTWQALMEAIGAENAAREFLCRCSDARHEACAADEQAASALYDFVRAQGEGGE